MRHDHADDMYSPSSQNALKHAEEANRALMAKLVESRAAHAEAARKLAATKNDALSAMLATDEGVADLTHRLAELAAKGVMAELQEHKSLTDDDIDNYSHVLSRCVRLPDGTYKDEVVDAAANEPETRARSSTSVVQDKTCPSCLLRWDSSVRKCVCGVAVKPNALPPSDGMETAYRQSAAARFVKHGGKDCERKRWWHERGWRRGND